jgi:dipeptidyl aminopeptidase/acylaminoacyl peptidase
VINGAFGYDISVAEKSPVIAFTATAPNRPSELYVMDSPTAKPRRLTDFNAWAKDVAWAEWSESPGSRTPSNRMASDISRRIFQVEAISLVLLVHGGPQAASKLQFSPSLN